MRRPEGARSNTVHCLGGARNLVRIRKIVGYRVCIGHALINGPAEEALKLLLEKGPTAMTTGLNNWTIEQTNGQNILLYKGRNYIP